MWRSGFVHKDRSAQPKSRKQHLMRRTCHDRDNGQQNKGRQETETQWSHGEYTSPAGSSQRSTMSSFRLAGGQPAKRSGDPGATFVDARQRASQLGQWATRCSKGYVVPGRPRVGTQPHGGCRLPQRYRERVAQTTGHGFQGRDRWRPGIERVCQ